MCVQPRGLALGVVRSAAARAVQARAWVELCCALHFSTVCWQLFLCWQLVQHLIAYQWRDSAVFMKLRRRAANANCTQTTARVEWH